MMTMGRGAVGSCVSSSSLVVNDKDHAMFVCDAWRVLRSEGDQAREKLADTGKRRRAVEVCARAMHFGSVRCHVFDIA